MDLAIDEASEHGNVMPGTARGARWEKLGRAGNSRAAAEGPAGPEAALAGRRPVSRDCRPEAVQLPLPLLLPLPLPLQQQHPPARGADGGGEEESPEVGPEAAGCRILEGHAKGREGGCPASLEGAQVGHQVDR